MVNLNARVSNYHYNNDNVTIITLIVGPCDNNENTIIINKEVCNIAIMIICT